MSADDATIARPGTPDPVRRGGRHGLSGPTVMSESELQDAAVSLQGHYSGPVTRLLAFALDQGVVNGMFALTLALLDTATRAIDGPTSSLKAVSYTHLWHGAPSAAAPDLGGWVA